jgi:hypothetical protein
MFQNDTAIVGKISSYRGRHFYLNCAEEFDFSQSPSLSQMT